MATRILRQDLPVSEPTEIEEWFERFGQGSSIHDAVISATNDAIRAARVRALFLTNIGKEAYSLLKSYLTPDLPEAKTLEELKTCIRNNLIPAPSLASESYKLSQLRQEPNELLNLFMSRIKTQAAKCQFGAAYDRMVMDRFLCGVRSEKLRSALLSDAEVTTSAVALRKALAREATYTAAHEMQCNAVKYGQKNSNKFSNQNSSNQQRYGGNKSSGSKQKTGQSSSGQSTYRRPDFKSSNKNRHLQCTKCTLSGHEASQCRTICRGCKGIGHIVKNCPRSRYSARQVGEEDDVNDVYPEDSSNSDHQNFDLHNIHNIRSESLKERRVLDGERFSEKEIRSYSREGRRVAESREDVGEVRETDAMLGCSEGDQRVTDTMLGCSEGDKFGMCTSKSVSDKFEIKFPNSNSNDSSVDTKISNSIDSSVDTNSNIIVNQTSTISNKAMIKVLINGKYLSMEVDSGATVTCIGRDTFDSLGLAGCVLEPCNKMLRVANGQAVRNLLKANVEVKFRDITQRLCVYVIDQKFPALFGRDWIEKFFGKNWLSRLIDVKQVRDEKVEVSQFIDKIKGSIIFKPGLGEVVGYEAALDVKEGHRPKFCKARPVPFAVKVPLGQELDRMENEGTLVKVSHSEYASPVVPIVKSDMSIRVCGDYKLTVNPNLDTTVYPLPVLEDCFAEMVGGEKFSKLDIKAAYNNLKLRKEDQILTTLNTHQGLYKWTRLPYGISSSGAIFQSVMDKLLRGIPGAVCRVDDILVTGRNDEEHMERLAEIVKRLEQAGFRCGLDKSEFMKDQVIYLGYEVSKGGVKARRSKVETIEKAAYPTNRDELISFLGACQYYSRMIPDMSTVIEPLNRLRTSDWKFGEVEKNSFDKLKELLASNRVLTFYDPSKPIRVDSDASKFGIGAVLSHVDDNGEEKPIEFISRTLTPAERKYSQIEKEALSIIWSVKRFHRYLYAREFELLTDHKPLEFILHINRGIPEMGTSRIQRWALILSHYKYKIKYRPTKRHSNADFCSRYPLPETSDEISSEEIEDADVCSMFYLNEIDDKPLLNSDLISKYSKKDREIALAMYSTLEGWKSQGGWTTYNHDSGGKPDTVCTQLRAEGNRATQSSELNAYFIRRSELTVESGCLLWGHRVVIPQQLRKDVLGLLHSTHMGIVAMKKLARNYCWWPKMDQDLESVAKNCEACQMNQRLPNKSVPHPWLTASEPWERCHLDYAGPFMGSMWLILVDSYSKWIEVVDMKSNITSKNTIRELRKIFSRFGIPKILVSDNGTSLTSHEFENFCRKNGINHIKIPSYHPSSNGQAEIIVQKFKQAMKKMCHDNTGDINLKLSNWLMSYHNTVHSATNEAPAVRMFGRRIRSVLSLLNPFSNTKPEVIKNEEQVIESEKSLRRFVQGQSVLYRDVLTGQWIKGTVREVSDKQYMIMSEDGKQVTKHVDHVVPFKGQVNKGEEKSNVKPPVELSPKPIDQPIAVDLSTEKGVVDLSTDKEIVASTPSSSHANDTPAIIRPRREPKPVVKLNYDKLGG